MNSGGRLLPAGRPAFGVRNVRAVIRGSCRSASTCQRFIRRTDAGNRDGLRKDLTLCHGMRRQLTQEEQFKVGRQIAEQISLSNYAIEPRPPVQGRGSGWNRAAGSKRPLTRRRRAAPKYSRYRRVAILRVGRDHPPGGFWYAHQVGCCRSIAVGFVGRWRNRFRRDDLPSIGRAPRTSLWRSPRLVHRSRKARQPLRVPAR